MQPKLKRFLFTLSCFACCSLLLFFAVLKQHDEASGAIPSAPPQQSPLAQNGTLVSALVQPIKLQAVDESPRHLAHAHPHGTKICASGCALSNHPTRMLTAERYAALLADLQVAARREPAFDELLYYGPQTAAKLATGRDGLSASDRTLLRSEIQRDHVLVEMKLTTEDGDVLANLPPQLVPLDLRHEYELHTDRLPPLEVSGTVKRVGRYDLWTRF
ncbi:MAG: hypothetical protein Fues2KO_18810 [Fuerstiella sp.]